jgi:hypothetical protein
MAIACLGSLTPALSCWIVIFANQPGAPHGCSTTSSKTKLDDVPMPDKVVADIEKMWSAEIKDATGKSLFVASKQRL